MDKILKFVGLYPTPSEQLKYDNGNTNPFTVDVGVIILMFAMFCTGVLSVFIPFYISLVYIELYFLFISTDEVMNSEEDVGFYFASMILYSMIFLGV